MQLFYNPTLSHVDSEINLDKEESRHIQKVLRKTEGDILRMTNGRGSFFDAEIISVSGKSVVIRVLKEEKSAPLPYHLHLAVAPTKLNDRYEWFLEKATEIGISEITPIICEHSERRVIKNERYEKIIQSAMKQSLKAHLPVLNDIVSFSDFIKNKSEASTKLIAHCAEGQKASLKTIKNRSDILILIGPEGDFSESEIELAQNHNFQPITLGSSRLRTETAAIVACHSVAFLNEK